MADFAPSISVSVDLQRRCRQVSEMYFGNWKSYPQFFCRAPGRVNLIGEHVDYMGFSVLPMALANDVIVAVGLDDVQSQQPSVAVINLEPRYPSAEFRIGEVSGTNWHDYVACGVKGAMEDLHLTSFPTNMRMAFSGNIPCAAGLSSSSALVCAAALAFYKAHEIHSGTSVPSRLHVASMCCKAERYIGTMGGGMDQAASLLSQSGSALHIEFTPTLAAELVPLPPGAVFVVANSLADSFKVCFPQAIVPRCFASRFLTRPFSSRIIHVLHISSPRAEHHYSLARPSRRNL